MLSKLLLVFRTLVHLRPVQAYYQVYYRLRGRFKKPIQYASLKGYKEVKKPLQLIDAPFIPASTKVVNKPGEKIEFTLINLSVTFEKSSVDWNHGGHGKLWTYNLNYFDFLFDKGLTDQAATDLIQLYTADLSQHKDGLEPYPISLRGINWIKFMAQHGINHQPWNESLYQQYQVLVAYLEYHLLANHLLENGFSLLFGAYYFRDRALYKRATIILNAQLEEQILRDGGHFERSPMYHQIILWRLLDCINVVRHNDWQQQALLGLLEHKAEKMLAWLQNMTFANGEIPMVKDAAYGIAPSTSQLNAYAKALSIKPAASLSLSTSGYRMFRQGPWELLADVGQISPAYQPGHAHADELNFVLNVDGIPTIVDVGVSTYEKNERRQAERATLQHNCVSISGANSSEVWGGFRVGRRARVALLQEEENAVHATHNGFKNLGVTVERSFSVGEDIKIVNINYQSCFNTLCFLFWTYTTFLGLYQRVNFHLTFFKDF